MSYIIANDIIRKQSVQRTDYRKQSIRIFFKYEQFTKDCFKYVVLEFDHKPSIDEVKYEWINAINDLISNKIINGFTWNGEVVKLSQHDQLNYKMFYDLTIASQGKNLPLLIKVGDDTKPHYVTIKDVDTFVGFYNKMVSHIQQQLQQGWNIKDSVKWEQIEKEINDAY